MPINLKPGKYTATVTYQDVQTSAKITVKKATPKITAKAKAFKKTDKIKKYTVTLKNNKNKVISGATVKITVNKKTYSAKTTKKGVATFKLTKLTKKGKFTATVKYAGSKLYNAKSVKVKITVKRCNRIYLFYFFKRIFYLSVRLTKQIYLVNFFE